MRRKIIALSAATAIAVGAAFFSLAPSARTAGSPKFALGYVAIANAGSLTVQVFNPTKDEITVALDMRDRTGYAASFPISFSVSAGQLSGTGIPCTVSTCDGVPFVTSSSAKIVLSANWIPVGASAQEFANAGDWKKIA